MTLLLIFTIISAIILIICFGYFCWLLPAYTKTRQGATVTSFEWMGFRIVSFTIMFVKLIKEMSIER